MHAVRVPLLLRRAAQCSEQCRLESSGAVEKADVVIVGGGMVGNAFAAALGTQPQLRDLSVRVLEAGPPIDVDAAPGPMSNRVSSIAPASQRFFQDLGVWEELEANPVRQMQVWDACSRSRITYDEARPGRPISWLVENAAIVSGLLRRIRAACPNVQHTYGVKVQSIRIPYTPEEPASVVLEDGRSFVAKLLVGADGARSAVRASLGCRYVSWEYGQVGLVATLAVPHAGDANSVAWQRFSKNGPIALLPLGKDLTSLVWSTTAEEAATLLQLDDDAFVVRLNDALHSDAGQSQLANAALFQLSQLQRFFRPGSHRPPESGGVPVVASVRPGSRAAFPLGLGHATRYIGQRTALVGDAAHRIHPLGGMGVNLGFGDARRLARAVAEARGAGADIGSAQYLEDYERARMARNVAVMGSCDGLNRLFSTDIAPVVALRGLGLSILDALPPLKKMIVSQASR